MLVCKYGLRWRYAASGSGAASMLSAHVSLCGALAVAALEEVVAELSVELAGGEHVVADLEDRVRDSDHGALVAASLPDPPVLRSQVAACARGGKRGLDQGASQLGAALARRPALASSRPTRCCPAREARCRLEGKTLMSTPISATITSALRRPTPGIDSSSLSAGTKGAICSPIRAEQAAIASSR